MEKWEYLYLVLDAIYSHKDTATLNGKEIKLSSHLNQLGDEGWEIFTIEFIKTGALFMFFRRRKPKQSAVKKKQPSKTAETEKDPYATQVIDRPKKK
jgi:hypothetical protein